MYNWTDALALWDNPRTTVLIFRLAHSYIARALNCSYSSTDQYYSGFVLAIW